MSDNDYLVSKMLSSEPDLQVRKLALKFYHLLKGHLLKENTVEESQIQHFKCIK